MIHRNVNSPEIDSSPGKQEQSAIRPYEARLAYLFDLGMEALDARQWSRAQKAFSNIVKIQPDYQRYGYRANHLLENARYEQAGEEALQVGDLETALTAYEKAVDFKRVAKIREMLDQRELKAKAVRYERQGEWRSAAWIYDQLLQAYPQHRHQAAWQAALTRCWERELAPEFDAGLTAMEAEDWLAAKKAFTKIVCTDPFYRRNQKSAAVLLDAAKMALTSEANAALKAGDTQQALVLYKEIGNFERVEEVEQFLQLRTREEAKAEALVMAEKWEEAAAKYEYLQTLYYDENGRCQWQEATQHCRKEARLAQLFARATAAYETGDWQEASDLLFKLLQERPNYQKDGQTAKNLRHRAAVKALLARLFAPESRPFNLLATLLKAQ